MEVERIDVNIPNIKCMIESKIYQHHTFVAMLQYISHARRDINILAIFVIFVEQRFIISRQINAIAKKLLFACSAVTKSSLLTTSQIDSTMYESNL